MSNQKTIHPHAFNYQLQRLMIGIVAIALPLLVMVFGCKGLTSISASYHTTSRDIFVACLASVGMLMIPYQGKSGEDKAETLLAKVGGLAAIVVAFVPTDCVEGCAEKSSQIASCIVCVACSNANLLVHYGAAIVVFGSLFWLCWIFSLRAFDKYHNEHFRTAQARAYIYYVCMGGIAIGAFVIGLNFLDIKTFGERTVFWGEAIMLFSFAIAWLTASKLIISDSQNSRG